MCLLPKRRQLPAVLYDKVTNKIQKISFEASDKLFLNSDKSMTRKENQTFLLIFSISDTLYFSLQIHFNDNIR